MKMISALVVFCIIAAASAQGRPAYICEVLLDNFCPTNAATCANDPVIHFGSNAYGFENFNLVSFGSMYAPSGDVEGRTAVRNNVDLTAYSIGYQLRTAGVSANSPSLPFTMVVGGDAKWHGGSVHPDGSGFPYIGPKEYIFVGGDFSNSDNYLQLDRTGSCPVAGCKNADFDAAQAYYKDLSAAFGALPSNVNYVLQTWGTIEITCSSVAESTYVLNLTPTQFSTITFWSVSTTCNAGSSLVVNIAGAGSQVKFAGATQTYFANQRVVYNVVPSANTPSVRVEVGVNGNLLAPASIYNQPGMGVFIGQVIVADVQQVHQINLIYCQPPPSNHHNNGSNHLCPAWEATCAGLDLVFGGSTYSFRDMNAISFGDFNADTGDIEGRLAVKNNCNFGNGYSIGYELKTANGVPDRSLPYSFVCGRDATWGSGALYPQGNGIPYPGAQENMFVGSTFTSNQQDLVDRRTGSCNGNVGCLDATFEAAKSCYTGYSSAMENTADNVNKVIEFSGLAITCNDASASAYYVSLTGADFASFTYTTIGNCNYQANWFINIRGTDDVTISGASFPGVPGGVVYNVIGCGRTITVTGTALAGHLLAPCSDLNQPDGVITGKVVAGNIISSHQINRENTCPNQVTIQVPVVVASIQSSSVASFGNNFLIAGDAVDGKNVVAARGDNSYSFDSSVQGWSEHQVFYVATDSLTSRTPTPATSGASVAAISVALIAFVALF